MRTEFLISSGNRILIDFITPFWKEVFDFVVQNLPCNFRTPNQIFSVKRDMRSTHKPSYSNKSKMSSSAVKEPKIIAVLGFVLLFPGLVALIPFNVVWIQFWDLTFFILSALGAVLLSIANSKIGWWIKVEDNVLYYSKFSVFSNWKKRRGVEFAIPIQTINRLKMERHQVIIYHKDSKKLMFNTVGIKKAEKQNLKAIFEEIQGRLLR